MDALGPFPNILKKLLKPVDNLQETESLNSAPPFFK